MNIKFYVREVYGKPLKYFAEQEAEKIICALTGKQTLSDFHKLQLEKLGCTFEQVFAPTK